MKHRRNLSNNARLVGDDDVESVYTDFDESVDASCESPSHMPSAKFTYVLNPNSSALSRKSYYKQLQKNKFESQFCTIIDFKTSFPKKLESLY